MSTGPAGVANDVTHADHTDLFVAIYWSTPSPLSTVKTENEEDYAFLLVANYFL